MRKGTPLLRERASRGRKAPSPEQTTTRAGLSLKIASDARQQIEGLQSNRAVPLLRWTT